MWLGFKKTILNIKGAEYLNRIFQMQSFLSFNFFFLFPSFFFFILHFCLSFFLSKPIVSSVHPALAFICTWDVLLCCQLMSNSVLFYTSGSLLHWHIPSPYLWFPLSFTFILLSVSVRPVAFLSTTFYPLFSRLSGLSISHHLPSPLCLSGVHSLTPLISFSPLPTVSTSYSCLSSFHTYLRPRFLLNCLHLHSLLVNYLIPYAAIRNCLLCLDHLLWGKTLHPTLSPVFALLMYY